MNRPTRTILGLAVFLLVLVACQTTPPPTTDQAQLTVQLAGTGTGTVTSMPAGIDTGATPPVTVANFNEGTTVTLTATPTGTSTFSGFTGCDSVEGNECTVEMTGNQSVTATFAQPAEMGTLTVAIEASGDSAGTVTSAPAGIDCEPDCEAQFAIGTDVVLTAVATTGGFVGWTGGDCDGSTSLTCTVTMSADEPTVTANFGEVVQVTETFTVAAASDTAEEFLATSIHPTAFPLGHTYNFSNDLELGYDPQHAPQLVGIRFSDVSIPQGATIQEAFLTFTAFSNPNTGTVTDLPLTIAAQASATPGPFPGDASSEGSFNISSRTLAGPPIAWAITGAWTDGTTYNTPNVASTLQQVVDLGDWTTGGAVAFVISPTDLESVAFRRAAAGTSPTLTVTYSVTTTMSSASNR